MLQKITGVAASNTVTRNDLTNKTVVKKEQVDECTIFVGRIPAVFDRVVIKTLFVKFGSIAQINVPTHNKRSKGYCFVEFELRECVDNVLASVEAIFLW